MPFQPVGNGAEFVMQGTLDGEECLTPFGLLGNVAFNAAELNAVMGIAHAIWLAEVIPLAPVTYQYTGVTGRGLRSENDVLGTPITVGPVFGSLPGNPHPNSVSFVITKYTAVAGRGGRGRMYWPGIVEAETNVNYLIAARANSFVEALQMLQQNVEGDGNFLMAVHSRWLNKALRPVGIAFPITTFGVRNLRLDSQRRRMPKE